VNKLNGNPRLFHEEGDQQKYEKTIETPASICPPPARKQEYQLNKKRGMDPNTPGPSHDKTKKKG
jgi:hypothetical protein